MTNEIIENALKLTDSGDVKIDETVAEWANRAFSMVAALGASGGPEFSEITKNSLSKLLAKAPTEVMVGGTLLLMQARVLADHNIKGSGE